MIFYSKVLKRKELNEIVSNIRKVLSLYDGATIQGDCINPFMVNDDGVNVYEQVKIQNFLPSHILVNHPEGQYVYRIYFTQETYETINKMKRVKMIQYYVADEKIYVMMDQESFTLAIKEWDATKNYDGLLVNQYQIYVDSIIFCPNSRRFEINPTILEGLKTGKVDIPTPKGIIRLGRQHFPFLTTLYKDKPVNIEGTLHMFPVDDSSDSLDQEYLIVLDVTYSYFRACNIFVANLFS